MNTEICSKNGELEMKTNEKPSSIHEQMNKVTSLLSFFSETTTNNANESVERENKNGNVSSEVSLSELTDIFGLKNNSNNPSNMVSRKRSCPNGNETSVKRKKALSFCSDKSKQNGDESTSNITSDINLMNNDKININGSKCNDTVNGQLNKTNVVSDKLTSDEMTPLPMTPAPVLTPINITQQIDTFSDNKIPENSSEYSSAREEPSELKDMPTLKEVSPISREIRPPSENNLPEKKKCEYQTCNYFYRSDEEYRFHNKGHVTSSAFKCSYCDLHFAGLTYLSHHEKCWCTLKTTVEKDLPKPLATSTPAIPIVRKELLHMPKPQRINFIQSSNEIPGPMNGSTLYESLQKKPIPLMSNKEIPKQNINPSVINQTGRDFMKSTPINNPLNLPESMIQKKKPFDLPNPGGMVLQNQQFTESSTTHHIPKPPPAPISFQSHANDFKTKRIYCKVESCEFSTEIETLYRDHYCEFHNRESNEICEYCSSGFSNKKILSQHKSKYCKIASSCIKKLQTDPRVDPNFLRKSMERQIFIDSDKREICLYECDYKGTSELDMVNHISNFHQAEGRFPCSSCELKFSSNDLLAAHEELYCSKISDKSISRIKGSTNDYKCPHVTCSFRTVSIKTFRHHLNGHCDNFTTRHSCNNCKQYFSNAAILEEHSRFPCCYKKTKRDLNIVNTLMDISYETC